MLKHRATPNCTTIGGGVMGKRGDENRETLARERGAIPDATVTTHSAPIAFLDELLRGPWTSPAFPVLDRAFSVSHGPEFQRAVIQEALDSIVGLTGGRVGYVFDDPARAPEIEFAYDPTDPNLDHGRRAVAVTYRRVIGSAVMGARIAYGVLHGLDDYGGPSYRPDSLTIAKHELGHAVFGFGHIEGFRQMLEGPFVMGGIGERDWHDWERQAVREKMAEAVAGVKAKSYGSAGWSVVACSGGSR